MLILLLGHLFRAMGGSHGVEHVAYTPMYRKIGLLVQDIVLCYACSFLRKRMAKELLHSEREGERFKLSCNIFAANPEGF